MHDKENMIKHLKEHQSYPASKEDLISTCDNLSDLSPEDKRWFIDMLPGKTYETSDEVISTLGWT